MTRLSLQSRQSLLQIGVLTLLDAVAPSHETVGRTIPCAAAGQRYAADCTREMATQQPSAPPPVPARGAQIMLAPPIAIHHTVGEGQVAPGFPHGVDGERYSIDRT